MEDKKELGLYQNVYRDRSNWGNVTVGEKYYLSPEEAFKRISKDEGLEYLFTAKMSSSIHKFEE